MLFRNKSVLVLGGSRGIGAAIVRRFSADGASVVFSYAGSREAAEKLAAETGSTAIQTDSADRDAVISLVREYGPLDILVVNAGVALFGDALEQDSDAIDRLFRINIHAPYHASVEAARNMPEGGRIIIIGSVNGDRMPVPGMAAYAASKSALHRRDAHHRWCLRRLTARRISHGCRLRSGNRVRSCSCEKTSASAGINRRF